MIGQFKIDFLREGARKDLQQEIAEGFYYHPDLYKKWRKVKIELEKFLKEKYNLKDEHLTIYQDCLDLLDKCKWFSWIYLSAQEIINLFSHGFNFALSDKTYPLEQNLSLFLLEVPILSVRDEYKSKIRSKLLDNQEEITHERIISDKQKIVPTVANWLKYYNQQLGTKDVRGVDVAAFLVKDRNIVELNPNEKEKIKRLFKLYEELKISALTVEGLEEEEYVVDNEGRIEFHKRERVENINKSAIISNILGKGDEVFQEVSLAPLSPQSISPNQTVSDILKSLKLVFPDEILEKRFKNIIISAIRNVRSSTEIAIILKRSQKIGGMGFEQEIVDKVMNTLLERTTQSRASIDREKKFIGVEKSNALIKAPSNELLDIESKMRKLPKPKTVIKETKNIKEIKKVSEKTEGVSLEKDKINKDIEEAIKEFKPQRIISSTIEVPQEQSLKETVVEEDKNILIAEEIPKTELTPPKVISTLGRNLLKPKKTLVEGVSNRPKIYGPNDELRSISLIDWRRWGTSQEAILKIQEKINLLAEDSLVKKAEGIKSWKESEINKLYLEIGEESINKGKSIEETINERQKEGKKTLTQEEFNAVVELNQKLRF